MKLKIQESKDLDPNDQIVLPTEFIMAEIEYQVYINILTIFNIYIIHINIIL